MGRAVCGNGRPRSLGNSISRHFNGLGATASGLQITGVELVRLESLSDTCKEMYSTALRVPCHEGGTGPAAPVELPAPAPCCPACGGRNSGMYDWQQSALHLRNPRRAIRTTPSDNTAIPTAKYPGVEEFAFEAAVSESQLWMAKMTAVQPIILYSHPCQLQVAVIRLGRGFLLTCYE